MQTNILKAAIFTPMRRGVWGLPLICWGEPGVAKTAVIEELASRYQMPCETLSPSERGEGAFGVVPVPSGGEDYTYLATFGSRIVELVSGGKGKKALSYEEAHAVALRELPRAQMLLTYPAPEWTAKFQAAKRGLVFVDEVTSTPPALQAPLMGLIHARRIGGQTLDGGVRIIGAANPVELAAGGYELSAPVANRFGHINWATPSVEQHVQFMLRGSDVGDDDFEQEDAAEEEKRVLAAWGPAWARAVGYETAFLQRRPALKNMCPKAGDPKASRAWASDRTWEMATRALASSMVHELSMTERDIFVEAFIGAGPASELFTFIEEADLPDPVALLDGKEKFSHNSTRVDRTVAVLAACTALVTPKTAPSRKQRAAKLWGILESMTETTRADLDILIPSVYAMIDSDLHTMTESSKTLGKCTPVLRAAGVTPEARRKS